MLRHHRLQRGRYAAITGAMGWPRRVLFREHWSCRRGRRCRRRRKIERQPKVPARGPIFVGEFAVGLQVEIPLHFVSDRENVADLWADADHPRLEASDAIAGAAVTADLLVEVTHEAHLNLLGQELRHAAVEVHVLHYAKLRQQACVQQKTAGLVAILIDRAACPVSENNRQNAFIPGRDHSGMVGEIISESRARYTWARSSESEEELPR